MSSAGGGLRRGGGCPIRRRVSAVADFAWLFDWLFACCFAWLFAIRRRGRGRNPHSVGDRGDSILPTFSRSIEVRS
jgi:hypothetical protein